MGSSICMMHDLVDQSSSAGMATWRASWTHCRGRGRLGMFSAVSRLHEQMHATMALVKGKCEFLLIHCISLPCICQ